MNHPYRGAWPTSPSAPIEPASSRLACLLRGVRLRRTIVTACALAFAVANGGFAFLAYSYADLAAKTLASAQVSERAGRASLRRTPHQARPPAFPSLRRREAFSSLQRREAFSGDGVVRVGATAFLVDASYVDQALEQQAELMSGARIVPEMEDGKVSGVGLFGVKPGTWLARLGFENGDVLRTINGWDMTSPDRALEAYATLRTSDRFTVGIKRKGEAVNLRYYLM
jgi:S1-C subfamily serine protease